ncbi:GNAT family N-acetyltransferase [Brevibacillus sp. 7WMA2]|uniref:GNAT family N-acetyltransferase n=1 Tax=Brevibacillus TaxID=55080 RepID=UPI000240480B|nr:MULTISPECIES: GNAT family protein [Brevibacillus]MBA4533079.1 GNAT family N-acetyltransferase [Brevibacillus halotolerans]QIC06025.1 GNAT family N-acetyltransferase [Brevibacillus sp. 7WMA2]WPS86957.1 GNAT family protein [Brevibacillus halotolerans]CCF12995.1 acetyltransferase family protein [Brevibacillus laterosporus GI-9]
MAQIVPVLKQSKTDRIISFRSPTAKDASRIRKHYERVFHDNPFMLTSGEEFIANDEQVAAGIDTFWNDPNKVAFIAECEKDLIGIMTVTPRETKRVQHVGMIALTIKEEWRGQRIGGLFFEVMLEWAEAHPVIEKLSGEAFAHNERSLRLLKSFGFVEEGRKIAEVKYPDGTYVDTIFIAKSVKGNEKALCCESSVASSKNPVTMMHDSF